MGGIVERMGRGSADHAQAAQLRAGSGMRRGRGSRALPTQLDPTDARALARAALAGQSTGVGDLELTREVVAAVRVAFAEHCRARRARGVEVDLERDFERWLDEHGDRTLDALRRRRHASSPAGALAA